MPMPSVTADGQSATLEQEEQGHSSRGKVKYSPALHASRPEEGGAHGEDGGMFYGIRHSMLEPWCSGTDAVSPKRARLQ